MFKKEKPTASRSPLIFLSLRKIRLKIRAHFCFAKTALSALIRPLRSRIPLQSLARETAGGQVPGAFGQRDALNVSRAVSGQGLTFFTAPW
jgi:hypothetical protein